MTLDGIISSTNKEITGSRTKNRLTVQISYAIQLIMEFYSTDFLVMMDYIEDISVIIDTENPASIHLYQVKTKSSDKQYVLSTVINEKWFQKLYANAEKYGDYVGSASLVCNTDIVTSQSRTGTEVFPNEKTALNDGAIQKNIDKIRQAIATDLNIEAEDVDLSKFFFVRSTLSTKGHKEEAEHQFQDFLLKQDSELQLATAKSIYKLLYDTLDSKFNAEISETCTDTREIYNKKGLTSAEVKAMISCGLSIQLPSLDSLFIEFGIGTIRDKNKYSTQYRQIKRDMYADMQVFLQLKKLIIEAIERNCDDVESMNALLDSVYKRITDIDDIPVAYQNEYYLKMLIMILAYKYCHGGEFV